MKRFLIVAGNGNWSNVVIYALYLMQTPIAMYILKLHGARDFDKYISSPKGVSLLKMQAIKSNQLQSFGENQYNLVGFWR